MLQLGPNTRRGIARHEDVIKTASPGWNMLSLRAVIRQGATPAPGKVVVVHYEGRFAESGEMFDSSYRRGEAAILHPADGVIAGWV